MEEQKNMEKYEAYKSMKVNLSKAIKSGFYYEAIFIEYAIIEDRCLSVLLCTGIECYDKKGIPIMISQKLNLLRSHPIFTTPYVRKRITLDFLTEIEEWKRQRDKMVHDLADLPYDPETVKSIAEHGKEVVRQLDNKVKSINRYLKKQKEESSCQANANG